MPAKKVPHETARRFAELVGLGLTHKEAASAVDIGVSTGERLLTDRVTATRP